MPFIDHPQLLCDHCGQEIVPFVEVDIVTTKQFVGINLATEDVLNFQDILDTKYYHSQTDCLRKRYSLQVR